MSFPYTTLHPTDNTINTGPLLGDNNGDHLHDMRPVGIQLLSPLFRETNVMVLWAPDLLLVSHATHIQDCHLRPQWALVLWREVASATKRSVSHTTYWNRIKREICFTEEFSQIERALWDMHTSFRMSL